MIKNIIRIIISGLALSIGYGLMLLLFETNVLNISNNTIKIALWAFVTLVFGLIGYLASNKITKGILSLLDSMEKLLVKQPPMDIAFGAFGLLFGLILAYFISAPIRQVNIPFLGGVLGLILTTVIYIVLGSVGSRLLIRYKEDILNALPFNGERTFERNKRSGRTIRKDNKEMSQGTSKVLDTSVIIDGRIASIVDSGFLDGVLVIPEFVLEELQYIADSADDLKRERGRRGLDIVKEIQNSKKIKVVITDVDYEDINEVDIKLLKLTKDLDGKVVTNDYNLNKVAAVQGIPVLNINDLANAVKTVVIPGEMMHVNIIKEGKEKKQGLAYLEDGTMIVVEDAKSLIGKDITVQVTTVLQTAAGKMIFAKPIN
ncbi:MAG: PIN domain nuclease [Tissierellia bacterium]|nr:PIN domain nuclease [Tissierellia bacterium]